MTDDEARDLATRFIDTWPGGTKAYIWRETLEPLDAGRAGTAYVKLRREHEHGKAPNPGQFMVAYNALNVATGPSKPNDCIRCDDGWVEVHGLTHATGTEHERPVSGLKPCNCAAGQERVRTAVWREAS